MKTLSKYSIIALLLFVLFVMQSSDAQEQSKSSAINTTWLILQSVPSLTWTAFPHKTNFAFEWEIAPLIYSFGMNKSNPKWRSFNPTPTERFAGSIEFILSTQLFTSKVGANYWGFSGQLLSHFPLIEKGEYLGFNLGVARYYNSLVSSNYIISGFSTLFGFFHYNIKYSPADGIWIHAIEFRFF